jgi:acyl carrier protein
MTAKPETVITAQTAQDWLVDRLAQRLNVPPSGVDVNQYFDEFELDSTEALILAGEMENWLGFQIESTAIWYHPTIAQLADHIAEEAARCANS